MAERVSDSFLTPQDAASPGEHGRSSAASASDPRSCSSTCTVGSSASGREVGIPVVHIAGYEIIEEVAPIPGEAVLRKTAASAFWGTPLVAHLNALRVDTVFDRQQHLQSLAAAAR